MSHDIDRYKPTAYFCGVVDCNISKFQARTLKKPSELIFYAVYFLELFENDPARYIMQRQSNAWRCSVIDKGCFGLLAGALMCESLDFDVIKDLPKLNLGTVYNERLLLESLDAFRRGKAHLGVELMGYPFPDGMLTFELTPYKTDSSSFKFELRLLATNLARQDL